MPTPSLHFLGWNAPAVDLIAQGLLNLEQQNADVFRRATIVTLTAPAAFRLRERLAELAGRPILIPRIVQPGKLLPEQPASEYEQLIAWVNMLKNLPPGACPNLLGEQKGNMSTVRALGTAQQLLRLRSLLEQEATTPEAVRDALPKITDAEIANWSILQEEESDRWNEFCSLCAEAEKIVPPVEDQPTTTRPVNESKIILAALPELSSRLRQALESVLAERPGHIEVWVNAPEEERAHFDDWGMPCTEYWLHCPIDIPEESIPTPTNDAQAFAEAAVQEAGGSEANDVVLGLCDPSFSSALCTAFAHAKPEAWMLQLSAGRRLTTIDAAQIPARLLHYINAVKNLQLSGKKNDILRAADSEYVSAFIELLRSVTFQRDTLTETSMDDALDQVVPKKQPSSIQQLMKLLGKENTNCMNAAGSILSLADQFLSADTLSDALFTLAGIIDRAYTDSPDMATFTETVRCVAKACEKKHVEPELALLLLQHSAQNTTCAPIDSAEGEKPSVRLCDWIDLPSTRGEKLLLLGLHEGCVPEAGGNVSFLTDKLKECLGLPTRGNREARDAFLLTALLKSRRNAAQNVRILLARQGADDTPISPSPLLLRCRGHAELAERVERLFSDAGAAEPETAYEKFTFRPACKTTPHVPDKPESIRLLATDVVNPYAADAAIPRSFSPSLIRDFLTCPLRFWLKALYGINPGEDFSESDREIGNDVYGNLLHHILRCLTEQFSFLPNDCSPPQLERDITQRALALLQEEFRDYYTDASRTLSVFLQNQYEAMRESLRQFALLHTRDLLEGWCVKKAEWDVTPTMELADGSRVQLRMKIDRVDFQPATKKWRIIDYKTHNVSPDEKHLAKLNDPERYEELLPGMPVVDDKHWKEVQLPLYAYALRQEEGDDILPELAYYNLPRGKQVSYNTFKGATEEVLISGLECARQVILLLREGKCLIAAEDLGEASPEYASFGDSSIDKNLRAICGLSAIPRSIVLP